MSAKKPAPNCAFIGLARDRHSRIDEPWPEHRCYSTGTASQVTTGTQNLYCLSSGHTSCPRFVLAKNMKAAQTAEAPAPAGKLVKSVKRDSSDEEESRWADLSQWAMRIGMVAAVVTLLVSLDFAFFRSMRNDTVRGESVATQIPQIRTYTLSGTTATVVPTNAPSTLTTQTGLPSTGMTGLPSQPASSPAINQSLQPALPTVAPSLGNPMLAIPTVRPANPLVPPLPLSNPEPPKVVMQPGEGPAGTQVIMTGSNWTGSSEVMFRWGLKPSEEGMVEAGTFKTGAAGEFSTAARVPGGVTGVIYLGVRQGNQAAYLPFKVTR